MRSVFSIKVPVLAALVSTTFGGMDTIPIAGAVVAVATLVGPIERLGLGSISTEVLVLATLGAETFGSSDLDSGMETIVPILDFNRVLDRVGALAEDAFVGAKRVLGSLRGDMLEIKSEYRGLEK